MKLELSTLDLKPPRDNLQQSSAGYLVSAWIRAVVHLCKINFPILFVIKNEEIPSISQRVELLSLVYD